MFERLKWKIAHHILRMSTMDLIITALDYSSLKGTFFDLLARDDKVKMIVEFERAEDGGLDMGWGFPLLLGDDGSRIICFNCKHAMPLGWVEHNGCETLSSNVNGVCYYSQNVCRKCEHFEPKGER